MQTETAKNEYQILLFYKYVWIENPKEVMEWQRNLCESLGLKGRLIIAKEGINITLEGLKENTEKYIEELEKDSRFLNIHFKKSPGDGNSFPRLSVKVRPEIVSLGLGTCDIDPNATTGKRLSPDELHKWFEEGREFYIVDMRNLYEFKVGRFEGSIIPSLENFRDLPAKVKEINHLKDKTVLTVCTGGVRCEKASGYLVSQGFKDVYQLENGIVSYMEKYPNENFKGKLYVFDNRVVMMPGRRSLGEGGGFYTDDLKHEIVGKCDICGASSENFINCANMACHRHMIACHDCIEKNNNQTTCPGGCTISRHGRPVCAGRPVIQKEGNLI